MRSGAFSHDSHSHAVVVSVYVASGIVRRVRIRASMLNIRLHSKLVLVTDLQKRQDKFCNKDEYIVSKDNIQSNHKGPSG